MSVLVGCILQNKFMYFNYLAVFLYNPKLRILKFIRTNSDLHPYSFFFITLNFLVAPYKDCIRIT